MMLRTRGIALLLLSAASGASARPHVGARLTGAGSFLRHAPREVALSFDPAFRQNAVVGMRAAGS